MHSPKQYTYQADAISANLQLNDTHYKSMHLYRVEWEPPAEDGSGGHLRWYTDDKFIFGINGDSLSIMQTEIPSEPMYLLMNTAVSSSWGFPAPCPENCECECFECGNPACQCALPTDYCENFPASFEIDYVRVYQAVNESKHILGCSPENRPTEKWIEGHAKRYTEEGEKVPLRPLQTGGMPCERDRECGGKLHGVCSSGRCVCQDGYTGPSCLAHAGVYDKDTRVQPEPFSCKLPRPYHMYAPHQRLTLCPASSELYTDSTQSFVGSTFISGRFPSQLAENNPNKIKRSAVSEDSKFRFGRIRCIWCISKRSCGVLSTNTSSVQLCCSRRKD